MTIKRNTSTEKNKEFWKALEKPISKKILNRKIEPPYLGDPVWESQHELSVSLLPSEDIDWKKKFLEDEETIKELKKEIRRLKKIAKGN